MTYRYGSGDNGVGEGQRSQSQESGILFLWLTASVGGIILPVIIWILISSIRSSSFVMVGLIVLAVTTVSGFLLGDAQSLYHTSRGSSRRLQEIDGIQDITSRHVERLYLLKAGFLYSETRWNDLMTVLGQSSSITLIQQQSGGEISRNRWLALILIIIPCIWIGHLCYIGVMTWGMFTLLMNALYLLFGFGIGYVLHQYNEGEAYRSSSQYHDSTTEMYGQVGGHAISNTTTNNLNGRPFGHLEDQSHGRPLIEDWASSDDI